MNNTVFHRGLLYALREKMQEEAPFVADGQRFHEAYRKVLTKAAKLKFGPASELLEDFDPLFGVYPSANEMLLEAERDFIIAMLNPHLQKAQFKISVERAKEELEQLVPKKDVSTFRALAKVLDAGLRA
jgi:5'-deoxynucleotidase YfbR-like HD superfamily hydrolase